MSADVVSNSVATAPNGVGGAVGMEKRYWFVAIVKNNTEKSSLDRLTKNGCEGYVATQTVYRVWKNGRRAKVDRVVLPGLLFVNCTEKERQQIVTFPYIYRFMTNKAAGSTGGNSLAVIPESQLATLRFMLGQSDIPVEITERVYRKGDKVKVARGKLCGLEGEVVTGSDGGHELIVRIDILGCAKVVIDPVDVEPIN